MAEPKFGPAGNSLSFYAAGMKSTKQAPRWVKEFGLDAYEYQCGSGVIGSDANFMAVGEEARRYGIAMSLHTPYFISLSGTDPEKRLKSIEYIRKSVHAAELLGADIIVIHTGSATKISREEAVALAKDTISRALDEIDTQVIFGLETMERLTRSLRYAASAKGSLPSSISDTSTRVTAEACSLPRTITAGCLTESAQPSVPEKQSGSTAIFQR